MIFIFVILVVALIVIFIVIGFGCRVNEKNIEKGGGSDIGVKNIKKLYDNDKDVISALILIRTDRTDSSWPWWKFFITPYTPLTSDTDYAVSIDELRSMKKFKTFQYYMIIVREIFIQSVFNRKDLQMLLNNDRTYIISYIRSVCCSFNAFYEYDIRISNFFAYAIVGLSQGNKKKHFEILEMLCDTNQVKWSLEYKDKKTGIQLYKNALHNIDMEVPDKSSFDGILQMTELRSNDRSRLTGHNQLESYISKSGDIRDIVIFQDMAEDAYNFGTILPAQGAKLSEGTVEEILSNSIIIPHVTDTKGLTYKIKKDDKIVHLNVNDLDINKTTLLNLEEKVGFKRGEQQPPRRMPPATQPQHLQQQQATQPQHLQQQQATQPQHLQQQQATQPQHLQQPQQPQQQASSSRGRRGRRGRRRRRRRKTRRRRRRRGGSLIFTKNIL